MLTRIAEMPQGLAGLSVDGTVTAGDLPGAIADLGGTKRLLVSVTPAFDGYMVELVRGLIRAVDDGTLTRCALVVPDAMLPEAKLHGETARFRAFPAAERRLAEIWTLD